MTIRSTLLERLRNLDLTTPVKVFFRDIVDNLQTSEDVDDHLEVNGWDDLRFPAQGINPPGAVSDPSIDTSDGTLIFSSSAVNMIAGIAQMPHSWSSGTAISPHFHYEVTNSNTGNMVWKFEYKIASVNGNFPANYTEDIITIANDGANIGRHKIVASWNDIDMSAFTGVSAIIKWRISRLGNDAADTYSSTTKFLEFDIHYQKDRFGSENISGP